MKIINNFGIISSVSEARAQEMIERGEGKLFVETKVVKNSLEDKTEEELREIAKEKGIKGFALMKRDTLIEKLS